MPTIQEKPNILQTILNKYEINKQGYHCVLEKLQGMKENTHKIQDLSQLKFNQYQQCFLKIDAALQQQSTKTITTTRTIYLAL